MGNELKELKGNKYLFKKWSDLGERIKLLRGIVQNDMVTTHHIVTEWFDAADDLSDELFALIEATCEHHNISRSSEQLNKRSPLNK